MNTYTQYINARDSDFLFLSYFPLFFVRDSSIHIQMQRPRFSLDPLARSPGKESLSLSLSMKGNWFGEEEAKFPRMSADEEKQAPKQCIKRSLPFLFYPLEINITVVPIELGP